MLDIKYLRQNLDEVTSKLKKKKFHFDSALFQQLDSQRKELDINSQNLQAERKQASKQIGQLVQSGMSVDEAKAKVNEQLNTIADQLDGLLEQAKSVQSQLDEMLMGIPNLPSDEVPEGNDENDNQLVYTWGEVPSFDFKVKDHVDLGQGIGQLDFELAAKLTGSRFAVMQGDIASLHRALAQFMLNTHLANGYTEVNVPVIVNSDSLKGTGQLPKFEEDLFKLHHDQEFYLIPTAEVPVTNLVRDEIIGEHDFNTFGTLPIRFAAHTACFRSEAGSYGRDTRGMIRQHQFEKVELLHLSKPEDSDQELEKLTLQAESILKALELPYRKVLLCGGDLGFSAIKTYDLEVWLPAQNTYREISSCSNCGDFQARRMKARYRNDETGKPEYLHTLNGSGLAVGRTLVAVLENYQNADGSITVPKILVPYMAGKTVITAR